MMIFGFLPQNLKTQAVAVAFSIAWLAGEVEPRLEGAQARGLLGAFRRELYWCFTARADALPCVWAGQRQPADDPGLAVFGGGRAGAGADVVDGGAGRGPPGASR